MKSPRLAILILAVPASFFITFLSAAPPSTTPTTTKKTTTGKAPVQQAPAKKTVAAAAPKAPAKAAPKAAAKAPAKGAATTAAAARHARQRQPVVRYTPVQMSPAPDRVKEIQQALIEHGYQAPVDGVWGKETESAMAKFQQDQKIEGGGKLTSLSLIALGLGPKKE